MSICELLIDSGGSALMDSQKSPEEKQNIQNELIWGLTYRNFKENEKKKPMRPMRSPIDIPFEICRAEMILRKRKRGKPTFSREKIDAAEVGKKDSGESQVRRSQSIERFKTLKNKSVEKPSLLDRSVWSQKKYMDFLSIPNPKFEEPNVKKYKRRCELEPCPPRFVQLAVPNKRKVFANWKDYADSLPAEILMRFEEILHTDQNLEPREARYYYKKLDRQRKRKLKKKKRLEKKKKLQKEKDSNWQKTQIDILAKNIADYIQDEPLFTLNYKQMLLSDGILERLEATKLMKKPSRKTKDHYKKTIIEVADKFAIWIDTLTRFVDVQAVESDEDIPPFSIASLSTARLDEGESSSEYESSSEDELRDDQLFSREEAIWGEEGAAEDMAKDFFTFGEGEDGLKELEDMLNDLDEDLLEKLISILSNCSDDFLQSEIDPDKMPGVKYIDVLNKLKELKKGLAQEGGKSFLEQVMIDWALRNDPDKVDDPLLKKIHEVAGLLGDWLYSGKPGDDYGVGNIAFQADVLGGEEFKGQGEDLKGQGVGGTEKEEEDEFKDWVKIQMGEGEEGSGTEGGLSESERGKGIEEPVAASHETLLDGVFATYSKDGGTATPGAAFSDLEGEEGMEYARSFVGEQGEGEEEEVAVLYEQIPTGEAARIEAAGIEELEGERLDGRIIKGHKPSKVFEHSPDTVCCLSLKTWAVWLLEITHNAHNWTQWMSCVIQKVREYASIVRGDVKLPNGETKVLRKAEWREFIKETEEHVVAWRQYSAHVKDLSQSIVDNFHGKEINCCPKCLQDHLIKNVVVAHDTLQALTEAISCAAYWQRCLDTLVEKTCGLTKAEQEGDELDVSSEESDEDVELEEVEGEESGESYYEIEGIETNVNDEATKKE